MSIAGFKIHFVGEAPSKRREFHQFASQWRASIEIHQNIQSLGHALQLSSHPRQIIVLERGEKTTDAVLLSFARLWPTIVLENNNERGPGTEKKHCYWKLNGFIVGTSLNQLPLMLLKLAFDGLRFSSRNLLDYIPWSAATSVWNIETDATKKLSATFEEFFSKTLEKPEAMMDAVEFAKFSQNRAKGRGTFKTKTIHAIADGRQILIIADLRWFNKSEASLRTIYNGIKALKFDFAVISSTNQTDLQILARFPLDSQEYRQILMVTGMPGVKVTKLGAPPQPKQGTKR